MGSLFYVVMYLKVSYFYGKHGTEKNTDILRIMEASGCLILQNAVN